MSNTPKHILVIRLSAMGDVAMTIPVLRAFIAQNPNVRITILTRAFFVPIFRDLKNITVLSADLKGKHKGIFGLYRLSREIKSLNIDAIADLHNVLRSKILKALMFNTKCVQIHKGRKEKKDLISGIIFKQLKTTHQRYADVFEKLGFRVDLSNPGFPKRAELDQNISSIVGLKNEKWIGIAPFAQYESKMYPLDLIEEVVSILNKSGEYKFFLFGGGDNEVAVLDALAHKFDNVISIAGKLLLSEELSLISNLDCMVSMDSGNSHLAAIQGVKTITIWGITHPFAGFAPFNQPEDHFVLPDLGKYPNIPCSVYGNKVCPGYENVMRSIQPNEIIEKIVYVLKNKLL